MANGQLAIGRTLGTIKEGLGIQEQARGLQLDERKQAAAIRARDLFLSGKPQEAVSELIGFGGPFSEQLAGQLGITSDPGLTQDRAFGQTVGQRLGQLAVPLPSDQDEKPTSLPPATIRDINESIGSLGDLTLLRNTGQQFLEQGKTGLFSGTREQVKNALGLADPTSSEFLSARNLIALALAAQANQGRPTDRDFEAADRFLATPRFNASAFYRMVNLGLAKGQTEASKTFLNQLAGTNDPTKQTLIENLARQNGIDVSEARRINDFASRNKLSPMGVRRDMLMLQNLTPETIRLLDPEELNRLKETGKKMRGAGLL